LLLPGFSRLIGSATAQTHGHSTAPADEPWKSFKPGAPIIEPEVRRSANGVLDTTLRMQYAWKDLGGYRLYMRTYEGTIPGPTLLVKPGDVLRIKLLNDLPPNRDFAPANHSLPHNFNTTNFHSHGLHVSPDGIADNVMRMMEPGKSHDIEIAIPGDHVPGRTGITPTCTDPPTCSSRAAASAR
jgi:FtsP/CotA-like multicopper oxidase with cupredoxin domain